jgi:hypothetical protein
MLQAGLYSILTADAAIKQLLGSNRQDKTTGVFAISSSKSSDLPQIIFSQISGNTFGQLDGAGNLQICRIQFSCYGETYEDAKNLARAVKKALVGFNGALADGVRIDYCGLALEVDGYEESPALYNVPLDLEFVFADNDGP